MKLLTELLLILAWPLVAVLALLALPFKLAEWAYRWLDREAGDGV